MRVSCGMACECKLWFYVLTQALQWCMQYQVILSRIKMTPDYLWRCLFLMLSTLGLFAERLMISCGCFVFRLLQSEHKMLVNPHRNILDGDLLWKYLHLSTSERNELAKRIGTTVEQVSYQWSICKMMWPNDAIWWHRSGSSHYLNQCWLIIKWTCHIQCHFRSNTSSSGVSEPAGLIPHLPVNHW